MSKDLFSPGPYEASPGAVTNENQAVVMAPDPDGGRLRVCAVDAHAGRFTRGGKFIADADCPTRDANARLLAASWEMLHRLRARVSGCVCHGAPKGRCCDDCTADRVVIAKAEGN